MAEPIVPVPMKAILRFAVMLFLSRGARPRGCVCLLV
jgi:hypothetical protein